MIRFHPIPRTGTPDAPSPRPCPLAGSDTVWFDSVHVTDSRGRRDYPLACELTTRHVKRLSSLRAPIAGLTLERPRIMGILNVTPDSFSDGGDFTAVEAAVARARAMSAEADIIDIGGESTRPGAGEVPVTEEIRRVVPVIEAIRAAGIDTPISIDTRKARVAEAALAAGADIVNDVSAFGFDPELAALVGEKDVPVCLMHTKGDPKTMQADPQYDDVVAEVHDHLAARIEYAARYGITKEKIITDPGIGFGKTEAHNLALLQNLAVLHDLGCAVLLGASRKRFIGAIGGAETAKDRLPGSLAVALHGAAQGVQILRVHDTAETARALRLQRALNDVSRFKEG